MMHSLEWYGNSSNGMNPRQSYEPLPGTGNIPVWPGTLTNMLVYLFVIFSSIYLTGILPGHWYPIFPSVSANIKFCAGDTYSRKDSLNSSKFVAFLIFAIVLNLYETYQSRELSCLPAYVVSLSPKATQNSDAVCPCISYIYKERVM